MLSEDDLYNLQMIATNLIEENKGVLVLDNNLDEFDKIFKSYEIQNSNNNRNKLMDIIFKTKNLQNFVQGVILNENIFVNELIYDNTRSTNFIELLINHGFYVGLKMCEGFSKGYKGQFLTKDITLVKKKYEMGDYKKLKLGKWEARFKISNALPTFDNIEENCKDLATFAEITQSFKKVPILELNIIKSKNVDVEVCTKALKIIYSHLMYHLNLLGVHIPGIVLSVNFNFPGKLKFIENIKNGNKKDVMNQVINKTLNSIESSVPVSVPAILFNDKDIPDMVDISDYMYELFRISNRFFKSKFSFAFNITLIGCILENFDKSELAVDDSREAFMDILEEIQELMKGE